MATGGVKKKLPSKASVPVRNSGSDPLYLGMVNSHKPIGEEIMGWIACCVLVALMLPLGAILYLDILDTKHEAKRALEKLEKIEQRIERKQRDKDRKEPDSISDNPVFDRVRRPL